MATHTQAAKFKSKSKYWSKYRFSTLIKTQAFEYNYKRPEGECYWKNDKIFLFYPCIEFMRNRIAIANNNGMGVFAWDGGQGPYYFYHLL